MSGASSGNLPASRPSTVKVSNAGSVRSLYPITGPRTVDSSEQGTRVATYAETKFGQSAHSRLRQLLDQPLNFGTRERQIGRKKAGRMVAGCR